MKPGTGARFQRQILIIGIGQFRRLLRLSCHRFGKNPNVIECSKLIVARAKTDATALIARRAKAAEEKIAAAERAAIADVRNKAASAAAAAAAQLIATHHDAKADAALIDQSIAALN